MMKKTDKIEYPDLLIGVIDTSQEKLDSLAKTLFLLEDYASKELTDEWDKNLIELHEDLQDLKSLIEDDMDIKNSYRRNK